MVESGTKGSGIFVTRNFVSGDEACNIQSFVDTHTSEFVRSQIE
jgi:hypothetical protein